MKLQGWQKSKAWADGYWSEIERIIRGVAGHIVDVRIADDEADQSRATDYIITVAAGDIACRVRTWYYWERHGDMTIRSLRPSGATTELEKIRAGHGRWYLYAWAKQDKTFGAWIFIDLDVLRKSGLLEMPRPTWPNKDGSSEFIALGLDELSKVHAIIRAGGDAIKRLQHKIVQPRLPT